MRDHSRQLHDPTQRHLSPASADVRRAQGVDQVAGLALQLPVARGERAQLLLETAKRLLPSRLQRAHVLLVERERLLQGPHGGVHRLLAASELRLRELEEGRAALAERVGAQRLERVGHLLPRPLEEPLLLLEVLAGGLPPSLRLGALGALRLEVVAEVKVLQVARAELFVQLVRQRLERGGAQEGAGDEPGEDAAERHPRHDERVLSHVGDRAASSGGRRA